MIRFENEYGEDFQWGGTEACFAMDGNNIIGVVPKPTEEFPVSPENWDDWVVMSHNYGYLIQKMLANAFVANNLLSAFLHNKDNDDLIHANSGDKLFTFVSRRELLKQLES